MFTSKHLHSGQPEWNGQQFAVDDPRIPPAIRQQILRLAQPGWELYFADTDAGGEWLLLDESENLVEAGRRLELKLSEPAVRQAK